MSIQITLNKTTVGDREYRATAPSRGTTGAAGYDLSAYLPTGKFQVQFPSKVIKKTINTAIYSQSDIGDECISLDYIPPGARALIPTGVHMAIPTDQYGRVAPRSGLAWKHGLDVMAGVIDSDFRGDIGVVLINTSRQSFHIRHGDRIAQLVFERIDLPGLEVTDELTDSCRGAQGYGSTAV